MKKFNLKLKKVVENFYLNSIVDPTEDKIVLIEKDDLPSIQKEAKELYRKMREENLLILRTTNRVIKAAKYNKILEAINFFSLEKEMVSTQQ